MSTSKSRCRCCTPRSRPSRWAPGDAPGRRLGVPCSSPSGRFCPRRMTPWAEAWRLRLADVRIRALEAYAKTCLELGGTELPGAERAARELVDVAPFRESGHLLLMRALAASGNVAEALAAYERLRVLLRDELGVDPERGRPGRVRPPPRVAHRQAFANASPRPPQPCRRMLIFMTTTSRTTSVQLAAMILPESEARSSPRRSAV